MAPHRPLGTTLEDCRDPTYFRHVQRDLGHSRHEWHSSAQLAKLGDKPQLPEGHVCDFVPAIGWRARDGKNKTIAEKLATEDAAVAAALDDRGKA